MYKVLLNGKIKGKHIGETEKDKGQKTVITRVVFGIMLFH